jgi:hypothetical protein
MGILVPSFFVSFDALFIEVKELAMIACSKTL